MLLDFSSHFSANFCAQAEEYLAAQPGHVLQPLEEEELELQELEAEEAAFSASIAAEYVGHGNFEGHF